MRAAWASMSRAACGALVVSLAGGCARSPHGGVLSPAGPAARSLSTLGTVVLAVVGAVAFGMVVLVVWAALRRRGTLETHEPIDVGGGQRWIFFGGFVLPTVVLCAFFIAALRTMNAFPLHDSRGYKADIRVVGRQWWWEIQYLGDDPSKRVTTANEFHVPVGWPVEIELESRDVIHSFWIPSLHGKVDLIPGRTNRIRIEADTPGVYLGQCAEYCGTEHALMRMMVVAEPLDEYERWLHHEAQPAAPPRDLQAMTGQHLFEQKACSLCHTVRGTRALATIGPDLTHVAERKAIAAESLPNSPAFLSAWVTHAQSLKPAAEMPNLTELNGDELRAIAHYVEGLQ